METTDVLVIGAGPAGVTAAHTIGGLLETIVLEARAAVFPNGYVEVFEKMAKRLDIRMGHVVTEILRDEDGVTVKTANGKSFVRRMRLSRCHTACSRKVCARTR